MPRVFKVTEPFLECEYLSNGWELTLYWQGPDLCSECGTHLRNGSWTDTVDASLSELVFNGTEDGPWDYERTPLVGVVHDVDLVLMTTGLRLTGEEG